MQEFDFAAYVSLERRDMVSTGILGILMAVVLPTILFLEFTLTKFIAIREKGDTSIVLIVTVAFAIILALVVTGTWAAYVSFSYPAEKLTITSEGFTLSYPSRRAYHLAWSDRAAQFEIYYGNQTPSTREWLEKRYGGAMSGGQVHPFIFSPITLLTLEAQTALEREARRHGFHVVDTTNLWGNRSVYLYGPDVRRRKHGIERSDSSVSFDSQEQSPPLA
jgi:hypothetical protein